MQAVKAFDFNEYADRHQIERRQLEANAKKGEYGCDLAIYEIFKQVLLRILSRPVGAIFIVVSWESNK